MARNLHSGSGEQLRRQVATAVDQLIGSLEGQLKYRQLTKEHEEFTKEHVKDVEKRLGFVRRFRITDETPEPEGKQEQESLGLEGQAK